MGIHSLDSPSIGGIEPGGRVGFAELWFLAAALLLALFVGHFVGSSFDPSPHNFIYRFAGEHLRAKFSLLTRFGFYGEQINHTISLLDFKRSSKPVLVVYSPIHRSEVLSVADRSPLSGRKYILEWLIQVANVWTIKIANSNLSVRHRPYDAFALNNFGWPTVQVNGKSSGCIDCGDVTYIEGMKKHQIVNPERYVSPDECGLSSFCLHKGKISSFFGCTGRSISRSGLFPYLSKSIVHRLLLQSGDVGVVGSGPEGSGRGKEKAPLNEQRFPIKATVYFAVSMALAYKSVKAISDISKNGNHFAHVIFVIASILLGFAKFLFITQ
jgi:hypothetical protein